MIIGGAAVAASAGAWALTPRKRLILARGVTLEKAVPFDLPNWEGIATDGLVVPKTDDDLASKLYSQIIQRVYKERQGDNYVMLLIAYGDTQSDLLQLHRPEVCYAAFGFTVNGSREETVTLSPGVSLPARDLTATSPGRTEQILYWTRIGEYLPTDGRQQRWMKLKMQMAGIVPDGVLVRISVPSPDIPTARAINVRFAKDLLAAMPSADWPALIGSERSALLDHSIRSA